jgi:hypothetical protein
MKRTLQYKSEYINYKKLKTNKAYYKSNLNKLKFWFFYNEYSEETAFYWLYKNIKNRNQIHTYIKFFKIESEIFFSNASTRAYFEKKLYTKKCKYCKREFKSKNGSCCSVLCSNRYKAQDEEFKKILSESLKKWYREASTEEIENKKRAISEGNKRFYDNETPEEKQKRLSNIETYRSVAWNNLIQYCDENHLELLFGEEDFINVSQLEIQCKKCKNIILIKNKSKPSIRKTCETCYPKEKVKSKEEYNIFKLMSKGSTTVLHNSKSIIHPLELDVYDDLNSFAVEYNGILTHSYGKSTLNYCDMDYINKAENKTYHLNKTELCEEKNIHLFHIFENEWLDPVKKEIWKSKIRSKQGLHNKIHARKCSIKEIDSRTAKAFLEENHLQGYSNASVKIGLYYEDELVSVMTLGKSRFSKKYQWELIRMASKKNITVVGGAGKLLKYFERQYDPESLISYANRRWSQGGVYETLGFDFSHCTKPNYFYFEKGSYVLESRIKFQKHKLKDILEDFDESLSEEENMFNNWYRRIYDCGNKVYIKKYG